MPSEFPTLASFVALATEKHGGLYTYPNQPWPPEGQNAVIVCKEHGEFRQRYFNHLNGAGCPACWKERRGQARRVPRTTVEAKVSESFPTYVVTDLWYAKGKCQVAVSCPAHGKFEALYASLLNGRGCPSCGELKGRAKRKMGTLAKVKESLAQIHPTLAFPNIDEELTSTTAWVTVICPIHGESKKQPHTLVSKKQGCPFCGGESSASKRSVQEDEILRRFKEAHGDTYDYSGSVFTTAMEDTTICCRKHGKFQQTPQAHWIGQGCPLCGVERRASASVVPFSTFLEKAREIHGDRYEYVEPSYSGTSKRLTIICKVHGGFSQVAVAHLYGCDCPSCSNKGFNPSKRAHVYVYKISKSGNLYAGFGISNNLLSRDADHQNTFAYHGASGEIVAKFLYRKGVLAADLESKLLSEVPITSTGMTGFIREAAAWGQVGLILEIAENHHQQYRSATRP